MYLGNHNPTGKNVALKFIKKHVLNGNAKNLDMIFEEANLLKALNHKNIVKVYDCITRSKEMTSIIIMEYLEGVFYY